MSRRVATPKRVLEPSLNPIELRDRSADKAAIDLIQFNGRFPPFTIDRGVFIWTDKTLP